MFGRKKIHQVISENDNIQLVSLSNEGDLQVKSSGFVHWFDFVLCSMWIFFLLFFGIAMSGSSSATSKYIDAMAGIGFLQKNENVQDVKKLVNNIFFGSVKVDGAPATEFTQVAQLVLQKVLQVAVVAFVRALLTTVLNFLKTMLNKVKEAGAQIAKLFNVSGPAKNLLKLITGRVNVCQKVERFVNRLFAVKEFNSPLDVAINSMYKDRSLSSLFSSPSELLLGLGKSTTLAVSSITTNAQTTVETKNDAIARDQKYLKENLSLVNPNAQGCELSLNNITSAVLGTDDVASTLKNSFYALVDSCSTSPANCGQTSGQDAIIDSMAKISVNSTTPISKSSNVNNADVQNDSATTVLSVFDSFKFGSPQTSIKTAQTKAEIANIASQAAIASKEVEAKNSVSDAPGSTPVIARPDEISSTTGSLRSNGGVCANVAASFGSLSDSGAKAIKNNGGNAEVDSDQSLIDSVASGVTDKKNSICPAILTGASPETVINAQTAAAIQSQSTTSGGGGENIADAVISLLNDFLKQIGNLLIDTLFGFINNIISGFCSNFAIDAICDSLSQYSDNFRESLSKKLNTVRIASSKYNSYSEYISDGRTLTKIDEIKPDDFEDNYNSLD